MSFLARQSTSRTTTGFSIVAGRYVQYNSSTHLYNIQVGWYESLSIGSITPNPCWIVGTNAYIVGAPANQYVYLPVVIDNTINSPTLTTGNPLVTLTGWQSGVSTPNQNSFNYITINNKTLYTAQAAAFVTTLNSTPGMYNATWSWDKAVYGSFGFNDGSSYTGEIGA